MSSESKTSVLGSGWFCLALLGCLMLSGCQHSRFLGLRSPLGGQNLPAYSAIVLNYETTDFRSLASRLHPANVGENLTSRIQQTSGTEGKEEVNSLSGEWSQARIQIVYPHPDGSTDKGLARLVVTRKSPLSDQSTSRSGRFKKQLTKYMLKATGTSEELAELTTGSHSKPVSNQADEEIWQLDVPKDELDILISELSQRGFEKQERPRGDALVTIKLDEGALSKRWTTEPRLEGLMMQVYNEGELAAFNARTNRVSPISFPQKSSVDG